MFSQPTNYEPFGMLNENIYPIPSALFCAVILPAMDFNNIFWIHIVPDQYFWNLLKQTLRII
jgi:hypothetical protein